VAGRDDDDEFVDRDRLGTQVVGDVRALDETERGPPVPDLSQDSCTSQSGTSISAMVCDAAIVTAPVGALNARTPASRRSEASSSGSASSRTTSPAGVNRDPVALRRTSAVPADRSATARRADTACCVTPSPAAAVEMDPARATARRTSTVSRSIRRSVSRRPTSSHCAPTSGPP
jgi:hypothetical protein